MNGCPNCDIKPTVSRAATVFIRNQQPIISTVRLYYELQPLSTIISSLYFPMTTIMMMTAMIMTTMVMAVKMMTMMMMTIAIN